MQTVENCCANNSHKLREAQSFPPEIIKACCVTPQMSTREDGQEVQEKEEEGAGMALHDTIDPSAYGFHITQRPASGVSGITRCEKDL
ncbi:hypothetical protein Q7C36_019307 [Tachysurus vachellii]|uniref:Uncharacterized protein n=1 Tax=Tachysurus vachellii TaxID=175792 RepID=A0AA88LW86_TACVA|nr:hypothetical protein Q7C36_019307 [Tachysurus vachellii]